MGEKNDTSLIRLVISRLVAKYNWTYEEALDKFYNSEICQLLSDEKTGVFTYSPPEIISYFEDEI